MNSSKSTEELTNEKLDETKNETVVVEESSKNNEEVSKDNEETKATDEKEESKDEPKSVTDSTESKVESGNSTEKKEEKTDEIKMEYIDKDFCYDLMSVPTYSNEEYRLVTYIILWARRNNIKYEFDEKGNIYLTKGELAEGEYYPCVTAHLDTVQDKQRPYAEAGCRLDVKTRFVSNHHEIYVDGMGIGGDDKAGVVICLSMFKHCEKLKAAFFLCEERGCIGSNAMDVSKLDNVGYVMGFDSPELNRAAHTCSGVRLFSKDFFETYMRDICKEHGLTDFRSEPYTDVKVIRDKTDIMCMNFGTGYYFCHMPNEYCVLEEMDNACKMGAALIHKIGNTRHEYSYKTSSNIWHKDENGKYVNPNEDEEFFRGLSKTTSYYGGGVYRGASSGYSRYNYYGDDWDDYYEGGKHTTSVATAKSGTTATSTSTTTTSASNNEKDVVINEETLKYIVEKYDDHIKSLEEKVKETCKELGIDASKFEDVFKCEIKF